MAASIDDTVAALEPSCALLEFFVKQIIREQCRDPAARERWARALDEQQEELEAAAVDPQFPALHDFALRQLVGLKEIMTDLLGG